MGVLGGAACFGPGGGVASRGIVMASLELLPLGMIAAPRTGFCFSASIGEDSVGVVAVTVTVGLLSIFY